MPPLELPAATAPMAAPAAPLPEPTPSEPLARRRKTKLQWAAIAFVALFFLLQIATFIIVAPPLNNWHIENWFR